MTGKATKKAQSPRRLHSEDTKAKIRAAALARPKPSESTRAKMSKAHITREALISETIRTIAEVKQVLADSRAEDAQAAFK